MLSVVKPGECIRLRRTVTEDDVVQFAAITGDHAVNHVDEAYMRTTRYGNRIAHGVLVLGLSSAASTQLADRIPALTVSAGYDRVRFPGPVRIGDTVTIEYTVESVDEARGRVHAAVRGTTQNGVVCLVAAHVLAVLPAQDGGR
ncbi:3-hydroxybutyryl-CoA dehydratase [Saccharopolyspora spinosa]|uniref:3-hydroxybutyryl-CoA dehydratase n=2 Tax=Saccharopolyspora spinosa TaxID=60894 RepID=A0A2N3XY53_SACSN|nr:3-hydroxybutyryl-CoA dehydratase [Saccharopolyspora spinosa]